MRRLICATLCCWLMCIAGCASGLRASEMGRTSGIAMDLLVERHDGGRSLYRVFLDGTIGFAGAADASIRRITWIGLMSDEQIATLLSLLDEHDWRSGRLPDGENAEAVTYTIDMRTSDGRKRFRVQGESEAVRPVYDHLRQIALRRFERITETLPRPSREQ